MSGKNKKNRAAMYGKGDKTFPEKEIGAFEGGISKKGAYILAAALVVIVAGYIALSKAAPDGRDVWSDLAAILLVLGYLLVPFGIMAR